MKIIGIVGTRRRDGSEAFFLVEEEFFKHYEEGDWICSGGCYKGADRFAEVIAKEHGIPILIFYPNYKKLGKGAAFIRNTTVAETSNILIACVSKDRTGGTEDTIKKFLDFSCEQNLFLVGYGAKEHGN